MKRFILAVALLSFSIVNINCVSKAPSSYTPQTKKLYVLTDVVNGVGVLQMAAENAVPQNILKVNSARIIVQFCVDANTSIGQAPNGWYAVVSTAYYRAKGQLSADELNKFGGYLAAFEVVLNSFSGS